MKIKTDKHMKSEFDTVMIICIQNENRQKKSAT